MAKQEKVKFVCNECGKKFSRVNMPDECPKCHGADLEVDE